MLLDIVLHEPRQLTAIASHTAQWVWVLLTGLLLLGASQLRARRRSHVRAGATPLAMALFSCIGVVSAFRGSGQLEVAIGLWMAHVAPGPDADADADTYHQSPPCNPGCDRTRPMLDNATRRPE